MLQERSATDVIDALRWPRYELIPVEDVLDQAAALPPGATVTLTSSPGRGIEPTIAAAEQLSRRGFNAVPHVSARLIRSHDHLNTLLNRLSDASIRDIYVIGGDSDTPSGPFADATSLLKQIDTSDVGFEQVGVAGYPEGHPKIPDAHLWETLHEKQTHATYMITQMCFNPRAIIDWLRAARSRGITLPVWIGLPGVASRMHLLRIAGRIGVGESAGFLAKNRGLISRFFTPGQFQPDDMVDDLEAAFGDPVLDIRGFHLYTFNRAHQTVRWCQQRCGDL
jgi:methylenetetrahydrofolate reductase (NADPH)